MQVTIIGALFWHSSSVEELPLPSERPESCLSTNRVFFGGTGDGNLVLVRSAVPIIPGKDSKVNFSRLFNSLQTAFFPVYKAA
ncbi:hypothetical protein [Methanosarcina sp. 2.H.T.1A.15]|uniref:hypothetical protein n=1 Tax=Methanosarcina sp. 2.H.T.1A.15 TaxID=1483596 RepID=UPI0012E0A354|nr:hypothetical protein [Methanosarcina sp. 2.H.T.1A.15]